MFSRGSGFLPNVQGIVNRLISGVNMCQSDSTKITTGRGLIISGVMRFSTAPWIDIGTIPLQWFPLSKRLVDNCHWISNNPLGW